MNNLSFKNIFLFLLLIAGGWKLGAQDVHYTQMYATPLYINPAFTGNHECDYRAGVNYREQDASFTIPFVTYTAWGDTRFSPRFLNQRGWIGVGAHMYYDNAGHGDLTKVQAMLLTSYNQGFNYDNSLYGSLGIGLGITNRSININNLIFGDQWDSLNYVFGFGTQEPILLENSSIFYPDFNLGVSVHHLVNENWMYEIGGSISHINTPKESFYGTSNNRVGRKYIAHATVQYILSSRFLIKPELYFVAHEGVQETILGANTVFNVIELKLHGGLWHRLGRDIMPVVGLEYNRFTVLFSYDINVSNQRVATNYKGGFEVSLTKQFCARHSTKRRPCKFLSF
ncbi:MAG: PorP/SprF family type IX secretion system membrane protein [Bacteroidales bacterium]|nr:PorP/SprF family type IX secretion system membrane protein [Bacteroidales bacterium]